MLPTSRILMLAMISSMLMCAPFNVSAADAPDAKPVFGVFTNPQPVTIEGYSQDAMEPFISPDGNYLFFNDSNSLPQTNLYYATRIDDLTFQFQGEIGGANATGLNAVASMDVNDIFYFVSTRSYSQTFSTIYWGMFSNGSLSNVAIVPGISKDKLGDVNFDQCISPDGGTLYFVDGVFNGGSVPQHASIAIAKREGDHFMRLKDSAEIMRKINTDGLNYAPDISKSGLEFFFTRIPGKTADTAARDLYGDALEHIEAVWQAAQDRSDHRIRGSAGLVARRKVTLLPPERKRHVRHLPRDAPVISATPRRCRAARRSLPTSSPARAALPRYAARVRARLPQSSSLRR